MTKPICYFCGRKPVDGDYCDGCDEYICEFCDRFPDGSRPTAAHAAELHQATLHSK